MRMARSLLCGLVLVSVAAARTQADAIPDCRIVPLPDQQVKLLVGEEERLRWHFSEEYPRPFFYPLRGRSGDPLTRVGHPGAAGSHSHHRSIWFAHQKVGPDELDFWSDGGETQIRQKRWLAYRGGPDEAAMAVKLGWYDGNGKELLEQELIAVIRDGRRGETFVELQSTFRPTGDRLKFGKTHFGFLAVRVAKYISAHFGDGKLTDSKGRTGERAIFGKRARWMDYSGPVPSRGREGITYFDHPSNPNYPSYWHVREDGWMGASVCYKEPVETTKDDPLVLRYLLHAHEGPVDAAAASRVADRFADRPAYEVTRTDEKHRQFRIRQKK